MVEHEIKPKPNHLIIWVTPTILNGKEEMLEVDLPLYTDVPENYVARFILDMVEQNKTDKRSTLKIDGYIYRGGKPVVQSPAHEQFMRQVKKAVMHEEIDNLERKP